MELQLSKGLTLLELLVTLAVLAIVLSVATPNMHSLIGRQDLIAKSSLLSTTLAYARNEAVARVGDVVVCGTTDQKTCNGSSDFSNGWLVFFDKNSDGLFVTADGDELLKQGGDEGNQVSMTLSANSSTIRYTDRGESMSVQQVYFCNEDSASNPEMRKTLTISMVGSTRISNGGNCPSI